MAWRGNARLPGPRLSTGLPGPGLRLSVRHDQSSPVRVPAKIWPVFDVIHARVAVGMVTAVRPAEGAAGGAVTAWKSPPAGRHSTVRPSPTASAEPSGATAAPSRSWVVEHPDLPSAVHSSPETVSRTAPV